MNEEEISKKSEEEKSNWKNLFSNDESGKKLLENHSLRKYLSDKAKNHNYCKIYGEEDKLSAIFADHILYLTDGSGWNDQADGKAFNSNDAKYKYYAKSFTYSQSENVAMWMLYGGLQKKGVMVEIGSGNLTKIIKGCKKIVLGNFTNKSEFIEGPTLVEGEFIFELIDILYCSRSDTKGLIDIKRSDERLENVFEDCTKELYRVKKDYAWCYENEFRLILQIDKARCQNDYGLNQDYQIAKIDFGDTKLDRKTFYVTKSPNYNGDGKLGDTLYRESTLKSNLHWDLCENCELRKCSQCNECKRK